ncbi:inorganic phosphate transporter [Brooklawnia sp.]|uniref:inorganic phosphate transporter n=1 Tax=Brooklawnia sp. TaxID=2699740 RepID=UPI00311DD6A8
MPSELVILSLVIVTALAFDFTNGFHDTANAMATSIATKAFKPKTAVTLSAILNLIGAFLSVEVALTVTNSVVNIQDASGAPRPELLQDGGQALLLIVLAGLVGAITWNLITWLLGLPSSSSHALFGGLVGATMAGLGTAGVNWLGDGTKPDGVIGKVVLPALMSPVIAIMVASVGTWLVHKITKHVLTRYRDTGFRWGQIGSASLVALAHGTNDAQKTMGIITLALIASGRWTDLQQVPLWVKIACALAITLGTYTGGWRIIRTMGKGLVELTPPQGMAAEFSTASVVLISSHMGFALSTTHVATGSILGSGIGKKGAKVNWRVAARMLAAWCITLPSAAVMGALMWFIGHSIGGLLGALVITAILVTGAILMYRHSRHTRIDQNNVNADWSDAGNGASLKPAAPTPVATHARDDFADLKELQPQTAHRKTGRELAEVR